ncbi:MAG: electron transport complex subunit RsxC [Victivallaceae bacterium]|nr:electron transport complex subunit RsxC [Victivallaceae bacterium]
MNKDLKIVSFKGGVHPPKDGKILSKKTAIQTAPLLERYQVIVSQNIGAPPAPVVKAGDEVKKGQLIAEAAGFVSVPLHAPTSGKIEGLIDIPGPMGVPAQAIAILADGKDEWAKLAPPIDWRGADAETLKKRILECGIVGMGGAAFPSHVKLSPPPDKKIDYMIINGAECEPYLTADHRVMLEEPEKVLAGAAILGRAAGVKNVVIAVEINKVDAINAMMEKAAEFGVGIVGMKVQYPQGAEKQLIYAVTRRKVPTGALPADVGCIVQNAGTAAAVADAVRSGIPLIERVTTITGEPVVTPGNWRLRLGTPISAALTFCGGVKYEPSKLILGGPMMGFAQRSIEVTVMKNTSGILLLKKSEITQYESNPCIRCGRCIKACPMNLQPTVLSQLTEAGKFEETLKYNVMDCIECGACAFTCPAQIPLVQHIRRAKAEIRNRSKKR